MTDTTEHTTPTAADQLDDIYDGTPPPGADILIPQLAKQLLADYRALAAERDAAAQRATCAEDCQLLTEQYAQAYIDAFERLHVRVVGTCDLDATEAPPPAEPFWADQLQRLLRAAHDLAENLDPMGGLDQPIPHLVDVTHLPDGFDRSDLRAHEYVIGNDTAGYVSHQVTHSAACHLLPYGEACWFDDEWNNGQFTYDDIAPGRYVVTRCRQDVGDHRGEFSHTEEYLDYERIGDAPQRTTAAPSDGAGYSEESPF